ncbi:MAG: hypothetical protein IPO13_06195 [Rhodocyclaceae bacterium]|nr:hypothetical protein [Rhodocyclaceae bacterium]
MSEAGRVCPLRYRYGARAIAVAPTRMVNTLYVIGGLYGNREALKTVLEMHALEHDARLCFNGDFNWFNVDNESFIAINENVLAHDAILGNVEAEFGAADAEAGCGCAYPENVDAATVARSNQIHASLKQTAARHPRLVARLDSLPMVARYQVGAVSVGVVHGDADSLAGWRFDVSALDDPADEGWRAAAFANASVDVFASTHTCLPALCRFDGDEKVVINNGAAGMPNFATSNFGVLTRISIKPSPHPSLYGCVVRGVHVDALAIHYDTKKWEAEFLRNWPPQSPAHLSYFGRISQGPDYALSVGAGETTAKKTTALQGGRAQDALVAVADDETLFVN